MENRASIEALNYATAHNLNAILDLDTIEALWSLSQSMEEFEFRVKQTVEIREKLHNEYGAERLLNLAALDNLNRLSASPLLVLSTEEGYKLADLPVTLPASNHWGTFLVANLVVALRRIEALETEVAQMKGGK